MTRVDFTFSHDVDHRVEPARVEPPTDDAPELELVVLPPPSWHAPPPLPRLDDR